MNYLVSFDSKDQSITSGLSQDLDKPEELFEKLKERVSEYLGPNDVSMIEDAYHMAYTCHDGQFRKSGEPFIIHPVWVAIILAELELDRDTIIAGLLHDVVEDTFISEEEVSSKFGSEVAELVDGVTKLGQLNYDADKLDVQGENLRKMFLAMAKDIRVILIKLADRLHNMRTLQYMSPEKQKEKARETMDIYAPIAQRLGISKLKIELDDLSLKYWKPEEYENLVREVNAREKERESFISDIVKDVASHIDEANIPAKIYGRVKHLFSIYKKMVNQNKSVDEIYDLFAVRILVDSVKDCYAALGVIHDMYTPIPGRFKDYIAMPKPNMYQSLHTTVIGPIGQPFEVQIRTYDMHHTAEYGIAAHWRYKQGASVPKDSDRHEEAKLNWLREVLEWQQEMPDNKEFVSLLKSDLDLFSDSVYCFTPQGDVKTLPAGSTPVDFAYSIHSAVGNKMVGARVNGRLVPIDYEIQNGDRIYVMTSQNSKGPSRDWLAIAKSAQARNKINQWFKREFKEENIAKGKDMLAANARQKGYQLSELMKPEYQKAVQRKYGFRTWEAVLSTVGHGGIKEGQVVNRLIEEHNKNEKKNVTDEMILETVAEAKSTPAVIRPGSGIVVKGLKDLDVHFSKCCSPVPGDEIIGFVTRGRGISIHRTDCVNLFHLPEADRSRLIPAEWQAEETVESGVLYSAEIRLIVQNRKGMIVDISKTITERQIDVVSMNARVGKKGIGTIELAFQVHGTNELHDIMEKLRQIPGVMSIERAVG